MILFVLQKYNDVFSKQVTKELPLLIGIEHSIDFEPSAQPPYGLLYSFGEQQLNTLAKYIKDNLTIGRIIYNTSSINVFILFVSKKNDSLKLYINYKRLNKITIKNYYLFLLINELMDRLSNVKFFSKIDLWNIYHYIYIKESNHWKTVF